MTETVEYEHGSFNHRLRDYVASVATRLGVGLESCSLDPGPPVEVYVALDDRLARFPGRDLALLWDENGGWSAAVETASGEDLIIVDQLSGAARPQPDRVAAFVLSLK